MPVARGLSQIYGAGFVVIRRPCVIATTKALPKASGKKADAREPHKLQR
jgi:hypothetical protein